MCTRPLTAYTNPTGGRPIFGARAEQEGVNKLQLPCGKCPECTKNYYQSWAIRGHRELLVWPSSLFLTLTYDDEHNPTSLQKKDVQDFIKRIKKFAKSSKENPVRQIYCGEYGEKTERPHYHVILFNFDLVDKIQSRKTDEGHLCYTSAILSELWPFGLHEISIATPATIAYLFKYVMKKKSRKEKKKGPLELKSGHFVAHEFIEASRNPGIGAWFRGSPSIKKGYLTIDGRKYPVPKYFMEYLKKTDVSTYEQIANKKFDYYQKLPVESEKRKKQKDEAQKALQSLKKKI